MNDELKEKIINAICEFEIRPEIDKIPKGFTLQQYLEITKGNVKRITIQRRNQRDGSIKWVISNESGVASKSEKCFVYDGLNSSRTDEHMEDTRFNF